MIKIGLYGCGGRTCGMITSVLENQVDCEVSLCYDVNHDTAQKAAEMFNGKICSKEELLKSDKIDMILISLYPAAHADALLEAAETEKPIYIEKPVVTNRKDLKRLAHLAERDDLHIHVGSMCGYLEIYKRLDALVKEGVIGNLISGSFHWSARNAFVPEQDVSNGQGTWRHVRETGGELTQHLCHYFGWMRTVGGDFESIVGMCNQFDDNPSVIEDTWNLIIKFRNGALFDVKQTERDQSHTVLGSLEGTTGAIHWEWQWNALSRIVLYENKGKHSERVEGKVILEEESIWHDPLKDFIERLVGGRKPSVSLADGLWAVAPAILARESCEAGKILEFPKTLKEF